MTGKNPGRHGIFAFRRLAARGYECGKIANASDLRSPTIWDIAGRAGRQVGVINVPPSYPIRPVNGFVVSCMLTPPGETRFTHPPELAAELGNYQIDTELPRGLRRDAPDYHERALGYLNALRQQTRWRGEATLRLMQRRAWDLLCVVFYAPDRAQHYFWPDVENAGRGEGQGAARSPTDIAAALRDLYATLDDAVGQLVDAAGSEATVVIASDHAPATPRSSKYC
jgi:predicted AlkP superfamily phosphohydrolase/phosphomutase